VTEIRQPEVWGVYELQVKASKIILIYPKNDHEKNEQA
jgi:hypothetical protein